MVILSARIQDHQSNTLINFSTLLQVNYLQIAQQVSVTQITLQAQPIFIPHRVSIQKLTIRPYNLH